MFWISYSVTLVLASAIAVAFMAIRLVLSAVGRAVGWIPPLHQVNAVSRGGSMSARICRSSLSNTKAN